MPLERFFRKGAAWAAVSLVLLSFLACHTPVLQPNDDIATLYFAWPFYIFGAGACLASRNRKVHGIGLALLFVAAIVQLWGLSWIETWSLAVVLGSEGSGLFRVWFSVYCLSVAFTVCAVLFSARLWIRQRNVRAGAV